MKRKKIVIGGGAAGLAVLLGLLLWQQGQPKGNGGETETASLRGGDGASTRPAASAGNDEGARRSTKNSDRPPLDEGAAPRADDLEVEHFVKFFLPPMEFENATIQEAIARFVQVYNETAELTGATAQKLKIDASRAAKDKRITCTTPRAPADAVLRYLAAMAGNETQGNLPNFRLVALSDVPERNSGKTVDVAPDFIGWLAQQAGEKWSSNHDKLSIVELMEAMGIGGDGAEFELTGGKLSYRNLSPADAAKLEEIQKLQSAGSFAMQTKISTRLLDVADSGLPQFDPEKALTDAEVQAMMRQFAAMKGTDLVTTPNIIARADQEGKIDLSKPSTAESANPGDWTGIRMSTVTTPLGLGNQTGLNYEMRRDGGDPVTIQKTMQIPDTGTGISVTSLGSGRSLVMFTTSVFIDATGRPTSIKP